MNIYKYIKYAVSGRIPNRLKLIGLWTFLISKRRMVGVFFDPVMACNLRCKMCYISDSKGREPLKGQRVNTAYLERIAEAFYKRALKLQIGCSTEPTLFPDLANVISHAKKHGVPYVSLTTNGKLIAQGKVDLMSLVKAGLDELTLSLHGTTKEIYEELMPGAKFEELKSLTKIIAEAKNTFPNFKLRVNYTINSKNIHDLEPNKFWGLWAEGGLPDIIQLRPVQNMGDTVWNDFDLTPLKVNYDSTIGAIRNHCAKSGISCIAPELDQIDEVATDQDFTSALLKEITYCYISPDYVYVSDFQQDDTFDSYHRRNKTANRIFKSVFSLNHKSSKRGASKHLNYHVE